MQSKGLLRGFLCSLSLLGLAWSSSVQAAEPSKATRISDVALGDGGRLEGQVVDFHGRALSNVPLVLRADGIEPIATTTTEDGRFAYDGVPGGVYHVTSKNGNGTTVRAWTSEAAPPNAKAQAIVYLQNANDPPPSMSNGNGGAAPRGGVFKSILANPIVLPAAIATAIAVPIALSSNHGSPASP